MNPPLRAADASGPGHFIDLAEAAARATAAMKEMSAQFDAWLREELDKLEAARLAHHAPGADPAALAARAHDLKGLGGTYDYPLVTRIAGSLERVLGRPVPDAPLVDAHVDAIHAVVRDAMHDPEHPVGRALAQSLEAAADAPAG